MRRGAKFLVVVGCLALSAGCGVTRTLLHAQNIEENMEKEMRRLQKNMIDYYENMAQAYYLLGYGFFRLYDNAQKNDLAEAELYRNMAALYKRHYEDLKESVAVMRDQLGQFQPAPGPEVPVIKDELPPVAPVAPDTPGAKSPTPLITPSATPTDVPPITPVEPPTESIEPAIVPIELDEEKPSFFSRLRFWKKKP